MTKERKSKKTGLPKMKKEKRENFQKRKKQVKTLL